ncbi:MAG: branched-chain amino acid ABC transporter permease [Actinobacteria bacterium]|nr:branched-chain amino acid ABC transporter permease [Actinomycetota bacterium]MBV9936705.1 branched-chain amino acid ABC transporter permease [Actinomycetota bacterium]
MTRFLGYVVAGLANGTIYALVALGVVVVYRISRVVNLAHGAMGVFSAFCFHYVFIQSWGAPVAVASLLALLVGAGLGIGVERAFVGPVRRRGTLVTLVMTVGVLLLLTELTVQIWGPNTPPIASVFPDKAFKFGGTGVTAHQFATAGSVLLLGIGLYFLLNRTRYGTAIEAIAEDPGAARIVGLPVRRIVTATWAIGGASAALAGILYIHLNTLDQISLTFVLISSLVAAVLGGFNSLPLAVIGSLGVGVTFSLAQGYVSTPGFAELVVFVALLAILLLRYRQQATLETVPEF